MKCIAQKASLLCTPMFSTLMRRDRLEHMRTMIHLIDPLVEEQSK